MQEIIFGLASFLIAIFAFAYGATKLFNHKKPLYLQLLICAAGCFALEQLSYVVNIWCDMNQAASIGMIGIFGCNFFLLSANYGTLDRIVDDGSSQNKSAKLVAIIAPAVGLVLIVATFLIWKDENMSRAVIWVIALIPALPASYFNLKHILLPMDAFEILKATKMCNVAALVFYVASAAYIILSALVSDAISGLLTIVMSLSVLLLTISAIEEAKKWGI